MINVLPVFILLPLGAGFTMLLSHRLSRKLPDLIGNLTVFYLLVMAISLYFFRPLGALMIYRTADIPSIAGINLVLDGLSHLFLLTANMVAFFIAFYSVSYMEKYTKKEKYYSLFMLMVAGMNGVILAGDLISLFIFMELAAIAGSALVAFGTESEELEASFKYLVMGSVASIFILFAVILIYGLTGTTNMADISQHFPDNAKYAKMLITLLFLMGFGTKSAIIPFHAWLPDAYSAAPASVSAMLSGVMTKALGIYALVRIFYNILGMTPALSNIFMTLGAASLIVGVIMALGQWDFKRILAYHSISQIGYVILGLGLMTPLGVMGGLFHLFNHAIFKPLLFLTAGSVEYSTGTRQLKELGGLRSKMPVTSNMSLAASLAISGIPPFNGFWSKLFIIIACIQAGKLWFALIAVIGSILTLSSFVKIQKYVFFEKLPPRLRDAKESPWFMGTSMAVLALLCLAIGLFFPLVVEFLINPAVASLITGTGYGQFVLGGF
ncbi:MAG: proton-conducting transporter membrane subunit [bacterium]